MTMASDTPTDAPRTGDPTAPASESPASIGSNRRRKAQPHHRPNSNVLAEPAELRVIIERCDVDDPAAWAQLVALCVGLLDTPPTSREAGRR
jgi:hypothetical protein